MSEPAVFFAGFLIIVFYGLSLFFVSDQSHYFIMQEAYERGYAQKCIGTSDLYWKGECPEVE